MIIAGIDPGKSGAIAKVEGFDGAPIDGKSISVYPCPVIKVKGKNEYDVNGMRAILRGVDKIWIEKVHAMPKQGVTSMFSFGKGYGIWLGLIAGDWIPVSEVAPQTWKKLWLKDMPKDKGSAVLRVKQLFPDEEFLVGSKVQQQAFADAVLIAMYGVKQS